jgi:hypothetical protein
MPTARTQPSVFAKTVAKDYLKTVEDLRVVLKQKRKEYKEAVAKEKKSKNTRGVRRSKRKEGECVC